MDLTQKIVSLAKRRGFIFPSSEIYGGFGGVYDWGPLGFELKNNLKKCWLESIKEKENIVSLDSAILMNPKVWEASGHLGAGFADELVECKSCHKRFKFDEIKNEKCPECGGELTKPRNFNLMMKTFAGPVESEANTAYLRAETCQGIFVNFNNILRSQRLKIPFGVAQIGKSFRNEVNPKNFIFRTREFEQMEMEFFCPPKEADNFFDFWIGERLKWYQKLGIKKKNLRLVEVPEKERAHYARKQVDIEYNFSFASPVGGQGWKEIEGIHNRGDWDLSNHSKNSGEDMKQNGYFPYVIEASVGVERALFAFLVDSYQEIEGGRTKTTKAVKEKEILLKIHPKLAPVKAAVLPLVRNKPEIVRKAKEVYKKLLPLFSCHYDETGSIGRRYRREDEIGTLFCLTVDFESLKNNDLTVRNRDTMRQERIKIKDLENFFQENV